MQLSSEHSSIVALCIANLFLIQKVQKSINFAMFEEPQSSDEESPVQDGDCCDLKELRRVFVSELKASSEIAASLKRTCGLHLSLSNDARKLSVGLSQKTVQLYQIGTDGSLVLDQADFATYKSSIRGVKFFHSDPNSLMICTEKGEVIFYDLRSNKTIYTFEDSSEGIQKTLTAFDINQNDRVLCASTDVQKNGDSFLLFFDIRERKYLGSYWECHSEDITNVRFHPTNPDLLASGSVDGLINVFDISHPNEDDAMKYCFNVEDSIERLNWHKNSNNKDSVSCITTTNNFHLYDVEDQELEVEFDRIKITEFIKRKSSIDCNVVNIHNSGSSFILLAGSNYNRGECLRSLKYDNKSFQPHQNFLNNRQIIRDSIYNEKENFLITTGEGGLITMWRCGDVETDQHVAEYDSNVKRKTKLKLKTGHRANPY
ncbi:WD repeat-containing protein 89 [Toxorhynchites rutilus septentrionalis]|uniref:WD repeat-containing protein 89 n=1 Tax=Toxorhynchites rutilus septentrionalis TaxID=329112 RepID=UPI002478D355|nr:WD repeat-containing protein 89 [Toxorhynchites rutilus septentrionalis]